MRITRMAEAFHVLPYSGGLLEQPPGALFKMEAILIANVKVHAADSNREHAETRVDARVAKDKS